jgi:hypothetical protein
MWSIIFSVRFGPIPLVNNAILRSNSLEAFYKLGQGIDDPFVNEQLHQLPVETRLNVVLPPERRNDNLTTTEACISKKQILNLRRKAFVVSQPITQKGSKPKRISS